MTDQRSPTRLLLVEDDSISRHFMQAALEALPAQVEAVASGQQARALPGPHALWLIDAHLPDGDGATLLGELRQQQPGVPAIAHTADTSTGKHESLLAAGFARVLVKPLGAAELQSAVRELLPASIAADWDEGAALRALNGNAEHVAKLRQLFLDELPDALLTVTLSYAEGNREAQRAALHRLRASCGFVGAHRLSQAVAGLQAEPGSGQALAEFRAAAEGLLASPQARSAA